jgi:hypothetical protein
MPSVASAIIGRGAKHPCTIMTLLRAGEGDLLRTFFYLIN